MGNRDLTMTFINDLSGDALEFANIAHQHGKTPTIKSGANPVPPGGQIVIFTTNSNDLAPGPQGQFTFSLSDSSGKAFNVDYNHPLGTGSTYVNVDAPSGYTSSMTSNNLAHHSASCTIHLQKLAE